MLDREALEAMLAEGCSLEEIGRRVERHPSTVSYWLKKHGLDAAHRLRHLNRGGLERETLITLVAADMTVREIARELDRSTGTVRHWLRMYGLETTTKDGESERLKPTGSERPDSANSTGRPSS